MGNRFHWAGGQLRRQGVLAWLVIIIVAGGMAEGSSASALAVQPVRQGDALLLKQQERTLAISLKCPTFIFEKQTVGDGLAPVRVTGDIKSPRGIEADFAPIALGGPARLEVRLFAAWSPGESVLRKWARFRLTHATSPALLKEIILERIDTTGQKVDLAGTPPASYPALMDCFFAGVEFPIASTELVGGELRVGHRPGWQLAPGQWRESRKAVFGPAPRGGERRAFLRYIGQHRPAPQGLHINYNSWWTSPVPYTEADILKLMGVFEQKLAKPYGVSFDSFCIDMGWSDPKSLWGINRKNFPQGFSRLDQAMGRTGGHLGLWISPAGFYTPGSVDTEWAKGAGYESFLMPWANSAPARVLCLGGKKYARDFQKALVDYTAKSHLRQIKFDGYTYTCPAADHGHAPEELSAEAIADNMISVFKAVRKASPEIWLEPTCFGPGSPWWLFYANSMIGTYGDDVPFGRVPAPVYRESYTTARDLLDMQGATRLPIPIRNQEVLGLIHQNEEPFMNDAVMVLLRGNMFVSVYLNPKFMDEGRWKDLAETLKWARRNAAGLAETLPILPAAWAGSGAPRFTNDFQAPREPYGFSHIQGKEGGLVALRNPWIAARTYALKLDEKIGVPKGTKGLTAVSLFPEPRLYGKGLGYGDTLSVPLAPYETLVLTLSRRVDRATGGAAGLAAGGLPQATVALGQGIEVNGKRQEQRSVKSVGGKDAVGEIELQAELTVDAPAGQLLVLKESDNRTSTPLAARLSVDGKDQPLSVTGSEMGWAASNAPRPENWVFQCAPLAHGKHAIRLSLSGDAQTSSAQTSSVRASVWAWATKPKLKSGEAVSGGTVKYPNTLPSPETISLGSACLLEPVEMGVKNRK